uniref:Dioxygenase-like protein n=1 Tax=uncultured bacterium ws101A12 TaxID=1131826 RepID=I1X4G6_9BACT|nr:dioxygenase-like protein [uncultured bacterium ws101A12]
MGENISIVQTFDWRDLASSAEFARWTEAKLRAAEELVSLAPMALGNLAAPQKEQLDALLRRLMLHNFAYFRAPDSARSVDAVSHDLIEFATAFGLRRMEDHRSAGADGVVALRTSAAETQRGYIPYTPKPLNWHTDGYYNGPGARVNAFVLHCVRPAAAGGENCIIDPEIAYLRLRQENPEFIRALMHPEAMTIPENREANGMLRPASVGPVFYPDPVTGRLQMRYTARTRSIAWRDDPLTLKAADWLRSWLAAGDPCMMTVLLAPGDGILNNNVLHNRTAFEDGPDPSQSRLILRVRFHNRVAEARHGAAQ